MLIAIDTNVLVYAEDVGDAGDLRFASAISLIQQLPVGQVALPVQVLGELFNVLVRKGGHSRQHSRDRLTYWHTAYPVLDTTLVSLNGAMELVRHHQFSIWDAVVVSTASSAGCRLLLSEDMQDGFTWGGVTVVDPFAEKPHPLLTSLLAR